MAPSRNHSQRVFNFGKGKSEGHKDMKSLVTTSIDPSSTKDALAACSLLPADHVCINSMNVQLGGKGANLAEMASIGLSVPPGLTVSTEACQEYQKNDHKLPSGLWEEILEGLHAVEGDMGAHLGDPSKPLLLSVRSGAAVCSQQLTRGSGLERRFYGIPKWIILASRSSSSYFGIFLF